MRARNGVVAMIWACSAAVTCRTKPEPLEASGEVTAPAGDRQDDGNRPGGAPATIPAGTAEPTGDANAPKAPAPSTAAPAALYADATPLASKYAFRGRFDFTASLRPRFEWDNAAVGITFSGSDRVVAELVNIDNRLRTNTLQVTVDGQEGNKVVFEPGVSTYTLASGLGAGTHTLWLSKAQEYGFGAIEFGGFTLADGAEVKAPPTLPARRVLFIGSSTMSGWGADGSDQTTPTDCADEVNYPLTNAEHSIPRYAADLLRADFHNLGRGAAGILVTFAQGVKLIPDTYGLTIDKPETAWSQARWRADAVVMEAGGSDLVHGDDGRDGLAPLTPGGSSVRGYPSRDASAVKTYPWSDFAAAYLAFVTRLRADHPGAWVVLVTTRNQEGASAPALAALLDDLADPKKHFADGRVVHYDYFATPTPKYPSKESLPYTDYYQMTAELGAGCQNHTSPAGAKYMGERLAEFVAGKLGW